MEYNLAEFDKELEKINIQELKDHLFKLKKPCYESELLKVIFKGINIISLDSLTLFRYHFILFHLLYRLQDEFYKDNMYLHVHFMRTFLLPYPEKNRCHYYDEFNGYFCNEITDNNTYCAFHRKIVGEKDIEKAPIKYYYLDKSNYFKLDKKNIDDLLNGTWKIITQYDEYKKSFEILDLPETADLKIIKTRYKYLAKKYHPDITKNKEDGKKFIEINNAYKFLLSILEKK